MALVSEFMSTELVTIRPTTTVAEAATLMGTRHAGSALVMEDEALVAIFTERDVLRAMAADFDSGREPVSNWMTRDPVTVEPEVSTEEALDRMLEGHFRHLPVVQADMVVGVVSIRDLARASRIR